MSQRAMMLACRNTIKTKLDLSLLECEITVDGKPHPGCGNRFVAIHEGTWQTKQCEGLDELIGVDVTVTMRASAIPKDKIGPYLISGPAGDSMDEFVRKVMTAINMDYPTMVAANAIIQGNAFDVPLRFAGGDRTREVGASWFAARGKKSDPPEGLARTLHFVDAERIQKYENQADSEGI